MLHINVGSASNRYEESQSKKKIHPKLERQIRNVGFLKHKRTQKQIKDRETLRAIILFFSRCILSNFLLILEKFPKRQSLIIVFIRYDIFFLISNKGFIKKSHKV
jgi:hypothetical protein